MKHYVRYNQADKNNRPFVIMTGASIIFLIVMAILVGFSHQPQSNSVTSIFFADLAISNSIASLARSGS